jgi:hypothetical protein
MRIGDCEKLILKFTRGVAQYFIQEKEIEKERHRKRERE